MTLLLGLSALTACGSQDERAAPAAPGPASAPAPTASAAAFPVSIEHAYGTTVVEEQPVRVVALGYQDVDSVLALGVTPVAARYWFGDKTDVVYPWAQGRVDPAADVQVLDMPDGISIEKVAALDPDLIVGVYSDIDATTYPLLSQIAPTIAKAKDTIDYGTPWQVQTQMTGTALGKAEEARVLVADLEARFDDVAAAHPEWQGKEAVVLSYGSDGTLGTFASQDARARFFGELGFTTPRAIDAEVSGGSFYVPLSKERADLLDVDLVVWDQLSYLDGGRTTVQEDPVIARLDVMKDRRAVYTDAFEDAFAFNSVLSLPFVLDEVVPLLEAALPAEVS